MLPDETQKREVEKRSEIVAVFLLDLYLGSVHATNLRARDFSSAMGQAAGTSAKSSC